jgi:hypothetical protein
VGLRAGLDAVVMREILTPCRESNPLPSSWAIPRANLFDESSFSTIDRKEIAGSEFKYARQYTSGFHKRRVIYLLAERLLAFQKDSAPWS